MTRFILFGLLAVCANANAIPVSFTVAGTVDTVTTSIAGAGVAIGDAFTLTYTFESTTAPRAGSNFTSGSFFVFYGSNLDGLISGSITDIRSSTSVPEPTTLGLMGLALIGLALLGRRCRRRWDRQRG